MGEMDDLDLEEAERMMWEFQEDLPGRSNKKKPIWTDKSGNQYWKWSEISDLHLVNIVEFLKRKMIFDPDKSHKPLYEEAIKKFKKEMQKMRLDG